MSIIDLNTLPASFKKQSLDEAYRTLTETFSLEQLAAKEAQIKTTSRLFLAGRNGLADVADVVLGILSPGDQIALGGTIVEQKALAALAIAQSHEKDATKKDLITTAAANIYRTLAEERFDNALLYGRDSFVKKLGRVYGNESDSKIRQAEMPIEEVHHGLMVLSRIDALTERIQALLRNDLALKAGADSKKDFLTLLKSAPYLEAKKAFSEITERAEERGKPAYEQSELGRSKAAIAVSKANRREELLSKLNTLGEGGVARVSDLSLQNTSSPAVGGPTK